MEPSRPLCTPAPDLLRSACLTSSLSLPYIKIFFPPTSCWKMVMWSCYKMEAAKYVTAAHPPHCSPLWSEITYFMCPSLPSLSEMLPTQATLYQVSHEHSNLPMWATLSQASHKHPLPMWTMLCQASHEHLLPMWNMLRQDSCKHWASHSTALLMTYILPLATWGLNAFSRLSINLMICSLSLNWYWHPALLAYAPSNTVPPLAADQPHVQPPQGRSSILMSVDHSLCGPSLGSVTLSLLLTIIHALQLCFPSGKRAKCLRNSKNFICHFPPHCRCRCCVQITVVSTQAKCFSTTCISMVSSTCPHHPTLQNTMEWLNATTTQSWKWHMPCCSLQMSPVPSGLRHLQ